MVSLIPDYISFKLYWVTGEADQMENEAAEILFFLQINISGIKYLDSFQTKFCVSTLK